MYTRILLGILSFLIVACNDSNEKAPEEKIIHFGEVITPDEAMSYETLLGFMNEADEMSCKVIADVSSVCQTKGCWMTVRSSDSGNTTEMFVEFHDYGFFVPKDLSGSRVVMTGTAYWDVTSVEMLKHYAEDANRPQSEIDAITEPERELKFMATGVMILDPDNPDTK